MEYIILEGTNPSNLASKVNEFIQKHWKPLGGLAVTPTNFFQAMVRSTYYSDESGLEIAEAYNTEAQVAAQREKDKVDALDKARKGFGTLPSRA